MELHGYNNLHRDEEVKNYAQNSAKTDGDEHKKSLPDNRLHKFQQNNFVAYLLPYHLLPHTKTWTQSKMQQNRAMNASKHDVKARWRYFSRSFLSS